MRGSGRRIPRLARPSFTEVVPCLRHFDLLLASGQVRFEFGNDDPTVVDFVSVRSNGSVSAKEWTLITATRDGSEAAIYINGVEDDSETYGFPTAIRDLPLVIGGAPFEGLIDDVRLYDAALTGADILALFETVKQ